MRTERLDLFTLEPRFGEVQALEAIEHITIIIEKPDDHLYNYGLAGLVLGVNHCWGDPKVKIGNSLFLEFFHGVDHEGIKDPLLEFRRETGDIWNVGNDLTILVSRIEVNEAEELFAQEGVKPPGTLLVFLVLCPDEENDLPGSYRSGAEPFLSKLVIVVSGIHFNEPDAVLLCLIDRCPQDLLLLAFQIPVLQVDYGFNTELGCVIAEFFVRPGMLKSA